MSIPVVAIIKAKPGKEAELERILHGLVEGSHKEPGCVTYALHRAQNEPGTFVFVEKWKGAAELGAHFQTPHIAAAMQRKEALIAQMDVYPLDLIGRGVPEKNTF